MRLKGFFEKITGQVYWKERAVSIFMVTFLLVGNIVEMIGGKVTDDPAIIWIVGGSIGLLTIIASLTNRFRRHTPLLFKIFLFYLNFNLIYAYSVSTHYCRNTEEAKACNCELAAKPGTVSVGEETKNAAPLYCVEDNTACREGITKSKADYAQFFYILFSYILFVVICFTLDSRKELLVFTLGEIGLFAIAAYLSYQWRPIILQDMQVFTLAVVLGGNYLVQSQRLRLTQASLGASINVQFKSISENSRDTQVILDKDSRFVYLNPSAQSLTGYEVNGLLRKEIFDLVNDEDKWAVKEAIDKVRMHNDERVSLEYRLRTEPGVVVWVESIFSSFDTGGGQKSGLIFAETRNIEARKKLEEEIHHQMKVEEMLIKHSTQFINVDRTEIQQGIDQALGEFGNMLSADAALVYRMSGKLHDEFQSTNQWFAPNALSYIKDFNLIVKINHKLIMFLRSLRGEKASWGNYISTEQLIQIEILSQGDDFGGKRFYLIPMQSGNIVNGFIVFVFDGSLSYEQSSFFGLIGSMVANAFTRLRTETRLHEAQLTNEYILRALPDWLYIVDGFGEFTGTNDYSTLEPYIPDFDLVGKKFEEVLPLDIAAEFNGALKEVIGSEKSISFEYHDNTIFKDRYFKVIIAPFKTDEYLVIIRDVSDLKEAQKELESKALKLEQSNKELEDFAYVVSHDMKQPIRTIISYLTLLKKKYENSLDEQGREFVNFSIDGANKMSDLIRDILQYSRVDQQIDLVSGVSLNKIMNKVMANLTETIRVNNAEVNIDKLPNVKGNETMLGELFQNLVENGIKYNQSQHKVVNVKLTDTHGFWQFEISDNGIGFDEQYAQQIFKMFKRLHTDEEFQGTGIGLAICQKVVNNHGGKIWATSVKGEGSKFFFTLPKEEVQG